MIAPLVREAVAAARGHPMTSLLTILVVAGTCAAVVLTTGRTVAAERAALAAIDAVGTRSVVLRATSDAGLTTAIIEELGSVSNVESVAGFGPILDAHNVANPHGPGVALRTGYGAIVPATAVVPADAGPVAVASARAVSDLGLWHGVGVLRTEHGDTLPVIDGLAVQEHLRFLEPLLVLAPTNNTLAPLTVLVVLADTPADVDVLTEVAMGLLDGLDPNQVTIETSRELAAIRAAVRGELGRHGRGTILVIQALTAALVALNLLVLVALRRRDYGRRRALGARRSVVLGLLVIQAGLLATIGAVIGTVGSWATLALTNTPTPGLRFTTAVAITATVTAIVAALLPATLAANRDPLHELRVP